MRRLLIAAVLIAATVILEIRTAPVRGRTDADLSAFDCTQVTESRLLKRICYDAARRIALAEIDGQYYAHCNVDAATVAALNEAESVPTFYLTKIRAGHKCRKGALPAGIAQLVVH
jgi:hypothetical protein